MSTLRDYQHEDGGWGWWKDDDTDPFLTAYAVYGLSLARQMPVSMSTATRFCAECVRLQTQFGQENRVRDADSSTGNSVNATQITSDTRAWMMMAFATAQSTISARLQEN